MYRIGSGCGRLYRGLGVAVATLAGCAQWCIDALSGCSTLEADHSACCRQADIMVYFRFYCGYVYCRACFGRERIDGSVWAIAGTFLWSYNFWCRNDRYIGAALGTNLINNVPMAVVLNSALGGVQHVAPSTHLAFVAATIFGCDLGPNLTTVGSLATVLWLLILRRRNIDVSGLDYFKVGIIVTPLMLVAGALTIWLLLP